MAEIVVGFRCPDLTITYYSADAAGAQMPADLAPWVEVFTAFQTQVLRYARDEQDALWWWKERAIVASLASAVQAAGGSSLVEFRDDTEAAPGGQHQWVDLFASLGRCRGQSPRPVRFHLEGKFVEVTRRRDLRDYGWIGQDLQYAIQQARGQVDQCPDYIVGALFLEVSTRHPRGRGWVREMLAQIPSGGLPFPHVLRVDYYPSWTAWSDRRIYMASMRVAFR